MKINISKGVVSENAARIVQKLHKAGYPAYFVGGAVRDMLLGKTPEDIDIVTAATPDKIAAIFPNIQEVGAAFGVMLVREGGITYEVATFREERNYMDGRRPEEVKYCDDPELDVSRRDFTVNGMLYDPETEEILDYAGGVKDLESGILRTIGNAEQRFSEDYLRMLRAARFATRLNFELEADTFAAIRKLAPNAAKLSAERVRQELTLIFTGPASAKGLDLLDSTGLLKVLLPEIASLHGVTQPPQFHPEGDVYEHTRLMLKGMALPDEATAWSVLLHDVAKPQTHFVDENDRIRFFGHEHVGTKMAHKIMTRLRFSRKMIEQVTLAIKNHMRIAHAPEMRQEKIRRLLADENFPLELELHRLDCISSHAKLDVFNFLLDKVIELSGETELPPPLLTGNDLIAMGYKPGPLFKKILDQVADLQLKDNLKNKEAAQAFVRDKFKNKQK